MPSAPAFWQSGGKLSDLLVPVSKIYGFVARRRARARPAYRAKVPVICVGNVVAGGAGKTPTVLKIANLLKAEGRAPYCVSRGYGGAKKGPLLVDADVHTAADVGDEPLLLARTLPTIVAKNRVAGVKLAEASGADVIILDDGFQNPRVGKDLNLLVIDGGYGFGNDRLIPAGPLREPVAAAIARAHSIVMIGGDVPLPPHTLPVFNAELTAQSRIAGKVVAFAGIGRPEKFRATLEQAGATVVAFHAFPDHHAYSESALEALHAEAQGKDAALMTTEKDAARLSSAWRAKVGVLPVKLALEAEGPFLTLLRYVCAKSR